MIKIIRAQSLHQGDTIVFGNGQKRKLYSRQKGGSPRRKTVRGEIVGLEMFYYVTMPRLLPGVYHPRTDKHYESFQAAEEAGEVVIRPDRWERWDHFEYEPIKTVIFAWDQKVRVLR